MGLCTFFSQHPGKYVFLKYVECPNTAFPTSSFIIKKKKKGKVKLLAI